MESDKVSVVMPAYNCAAYIHQAIDSVLRQKVSLELIIIDDASTDGTEEKIHSYQQRENIRCIRNKKNQGVSASRNLGVSAASGEFIAFLDADDWWEENKIEKQLSLIQKTGCVLCCTGRELFWEDGRSTFRQIEAPLTVDYASLLRTNSISCSSVLLRRDAAIAVPMECDAIHEDYLAWLRILKRYGSGCGINEPLLKTRLTSNGKSRNKWKTIPMTYGVYRRLEIGKVRSAFYTGRHVVCSGMRYLG